MSKNILAQSTRLVQEGHINASLQALMQQVAATGINYPIAANIAALHLQLGDTMTALSFCSQAIALDPYCHCAYFNRFLCYMTSHQQKLARKQLHKALSCLYCLQGFEEQNAKSLNKSIFYCEQNAKAYLFRAKLNEGKNNKLAQNDYSAAIEYDINLAQIYQQRALFYRSLGKMKDFQADCVTYIRLKKQNASLSELIDNQSGIQIDQNIEDKIKEQVKQFQDLLLRIHRRNPLTKSVEQQCLSKLPLSSVQSHLDKKDDDELLLSDRPEEGSTQTITIKKEQIHFKKKNEDNKNFREIFEDESSTELDMKIVKLQKQIERQGGKILPQNDEVQELDVSDPNHFLTQQIEKAIDEISKLSVPQNIGDVKSVKSATSSKLSQPKELTVEQFNKHGTINLEVVSLEDIQNHGKKQTSKVVLQYGERICQTSMAKYDWRQQFTFAVQGGMTEVQVKVIEKGGIFRGDAEIADGTINLLQTHNVKCILGNKDKKVAILYFKMNLL